MKRRMKKTAYAILMIGLMLTAVFSALSVNAANSTYVSTSITTGTQDTAAKGTLTVRVSGLIAAFYIDGAKVTVEGRGYIDTETTRNGGYAVFYNIPLFRGYSVTATASHYLTGRGVVPWLSLFTPTCEIHLLRILEDGSSSSSSPSQIVSDKPVVPTDDGQIIAIN